MSQVIVIGGGLAGLAGAVALADAGFQVELYERRPILGGRATSFIHPSSGERVDNCQHVLLGCCVNLLDFYARLGVAKHIEFHEDIPFIDESSRVSVIRPSALPPPLHLFPSFLRLKTMGIRDKLSIVRTVAGMIRHVARLRRSGEPSEATASAAASVSAAPASATSRGTEPSPDSMAAWLEAHGATDRAVEAFWKPFLISALNDELVDIDADYGIGTAVRAMLLNRSGYEVGLPAVPLGDLYAPCIDYIEQRGGRVVFNRGVTGISVHGGKVASISLQDGSSVEAGAYLSALPFDVLRKLLPQGHASDPYFAILDGLSVSPITAVHVWFDRPVTEMGYAAVIGRRIQWIFNQSSRHAGAFSADNGGAYLGLVVSASDDWMKTPRQVIIDQAMEDLESLLPAVRRAKLLKAIVVKEGRATFAPRPGCDALRPGPSSPFPNFSIAGDWVQTGWPATMESAVRSGYQAAEVLLRTRGVRTPILKPDLPAEGLMKWVAGLRGF
ncbi:MAG: FAD-dependent oxidoreductase [Gemmatimonadetes bacterium]|nr:FAD-dependent oxidoreductase [Gemmatimonadota bacterium]MYG85842.1 FAD-dependent oxidoreductase [Gemmatimonadota bacterium]MYJ89742.1 FAD-dependent oxidoreductase [Gemmatimonadota bacterium]